ncbi:unnamed protein product [Rhizoctonia solani]|uniref:HNH nuclease domain-containing protein n=1 Tax=Rhizoctonia solani TaxID=456999 RepID=A0A8H3DY88_9AGAM|nr:unnamed protein product [Rhizoctonia solani]
MYCAPFAHRNSPYEPGQNPCNSSQSYVPAESRVCPNISPVSVTMKEELSKVAPDGECCLITRDVQALEVCYLVDPATSLEVQEELENAWGLEPGELKLDTDSNFIWLRHDMHEQFDRDDWALVPTEKVLMEMIMFTVCGKPKHFLKSFPNKIWDYHVVRFLPSPSSLANEIDCSPPGLLDNIDVIQSHVHPFFVAHSTGQKIRRIQDSEADFPPKYVQELGLCNLLRPSWGKPISNPHASQQPYKTSYTPSSTRSSISLSSEQQSDRTAKCPRCFDGEDSPYSGSGVDAGADVSQDPQHRECHPSSSLANSSTVHWTTVDDWVEGVKSATPGEDPHAGGTEKARQCLVDYGSEESRPPLCGPWEKWISQY